MLFIFILMVFIIFVITDAKFKNIKEAQKLLFREFKLAIKKNDGSYIYPMFKRSANRLTFLRYNPAVVVADLKSKELKAISKIFSKNEDDDFVFVEYEKSTLIEYFLLNYNKYKIVLFNSKIKQKDFFQDRPKLNKYEFWVGTDLKNKNIILDLFNKNSISIYGGVGSGKSSLANVILSSLNKQSVQKEYIFTKSKNDYLSDSYTTFIQKDNEEDILSILLLLKEKAISKQHELDKDGYQNIFQKDEKLTLLIFDECHSYLSQTTNKDLKDTRNKIIELINFFLKQCRSVGYVLVFLLPSAEKQELEVNTREVSYIFSSKIPSETVSRNLFKSEIASLIPKKQGLFVGSKNDEPLVFQVPKIEWKTKWN